VTANGEQPSYSKRLKRPLAWWVRQVHFYVSMGSTVLLLFFVATGFIAARPDLFNTDDLPMEVSRGTIPADVPLEAPAIAKWLSTTFPGRFREKTVDRDDREIRFELESVWAWHAIAVEIQTRDYVAETTPSTWASATIGLHRGKWAGKLQRLLVDVTAMALLLVLVTGVGMTLTHPDRQRRWWAWGLMVFSALLVVLLCIGR